MVWSEEIFNERIDRQREATPGRAMLTLPRNDPRDGIRLAPRTALRFFSFAV